MRRKQPDPNCDLCKGTGEVDVAVWDNDSHTYQPTGTQPCICTAIDEDDSDDYRDNTGGSQPIRPIYPIDPPNDGEDNGQAADPQPIPIPWAAEILRPALTN